MSIEEDNEKNTYAALEALILNNELGLLSVLERFGITKPATPDILTLGYIRYGDRFADAIDEATNTAAFNGQGVLSLLQAGFSAMTAAKSYSKASDESEDINNIEEQKKVMGIDAKIFNLLLLMLSLFSLFLSLKVFKK